MTQDQNVKRDSSVITGTAYELNDWGSKKLDEGIVFAATSRPVLAPTKLPIKRMSGLFSWEKVSGA
jgi:hypothetical protein